MLNGTKPFSILKSLASASGRRNPGTAARHLLRL